MFALLRLRARQATEPGNVLGQDRRERRGHVLGQDDGNVHGAAQGLDQGEQCLRATGRTADRQQFRRNIGRRTRHGTPPARERARPDAPRARSLARPFTLLMISSRKRSSDVAPIEDGFGT